jgi:hypothetical protein
MAWQRTTIVYLLIVGGLAVGGCANRAEERRQRLRDQASEHFNTPETRADRIAHAMAILSRDDPQGEAPTMRWQAAHNLGVMGAVEARELLWRLAFSPVADRSSSVRRECVIALCKLPTEGPDDPWRRMLLEKLRQRVAFERTETLQRRLVESDPSVRMALLDGIVTLGLPANRDPKRPWRLMGEAGYRDAARALHTVLAALNAERDESASAIEIGVPSRYTVGMIEATIRALTLLTNTPDQEVMQARGSMSFDEFASWWTSRIAAMPEVG